MLAPPLYFYYFIPHDPAIQSLFNYRRRNIKMKEKINGLGTFSNILTLKLLKIKHLLRIESVRAILDIL